jgi:hypothetical protein
MWKRKAMLVSGDVLLHVQPTERAARLRLLGDFRARGYSLVLLVGTADPITASTLLETEMRARTGHGWSGVVAGSGDPAALWEAARRYDLDLSRSVLVSRRGVHTAMARCAGVTRIVEWADLEAAYVPA